MIAAALVGLTSIATLACRSPIEVAATPSVLLITIDTLRADALSLYGNPVPTSPALDQFMRRGTVFQQAFATASFTAPSHTSILTGLYPSFHTVGPYNGYYALAQETPTLAGLARDAGVATGAVVSNPVLASYLGLGHGFDVYDDRMTGAEVNRPSPERYAPEAVDTILAQLDAMAGRQFFLWFHMQDPHGPYAPEYEAERLAGATYPDSDRRLTVGDDHSGHRSIPAYQRFPSDSEDGRVGDYRRRYDAEVALVDDEISRLIARLEEDPGLANTYVVITADHGEAMGADDFYFGHSHSVGHAQVRVPLAIIGPDVPAGLTVDAPVSIRDVFPTVLQVMGIAMPEALPPGVSALPGAATDLVAAARVASRQSLLDLANGTARRPPEPVFLESANQVGVVLGKTFLQRDRFGPEDPIWSRPNPNTLSFWKPLGETAHGLERVGAPDGARSFTAADPAAVERLRGLLDRYERFAREAYAAIQDRAEPTAIADTLSDSLRALGYIR